METPTRGTAGQKDLGFGEYVRKISELISNEVIIALNKWYGLEYREQIFQLAWGPFCDEAVQLSCKWDARSLMKGNRKIESTFPAQAGIQLAFEWQVAGGKKVHLTKTEAEVKWAFFWSAPWLWRAYSISSASWVGCRVCNNTGHSKQKLSVESGHTSQVSCASESVVMSRCRRGCV